MSCQYGYIYCAHGKIPARVIIWQYNIQGIL